MSYPHNERSKYLGQCTQGVNIRWHHDDEKYLRDYPEICGSCGECEIHYDPYSMEKIAEYAGLRVVGFQEGIEQISHVSGIPPHDNFNNRVG